MHLTDITVFPVKSLAGIQLNESQVTPFGLKNDRMKMLVDNQGVFISQRKFPQMALIKTQILDQQLRLTAPAMAPLTIGHEHFTDQSLAVDVWGDTCFGFVADKQINRWLSQFLDLPVRLVSYDASQPRATDPKYALRDDQVSFADGFPLLVISQASLADLNSRLETPVPMSAFRPNIVIDGCDAYAEDQWQQIRVGEVVFDAVKPCSRCVLTTVDPQTGIRRGDGQPLKMLSQYRRAPGGVMFGMNLIPRSPGTIRLNDPVECVK